MRTIGVVTTSRADYGILYPVLRAIEAHPGLSLRLVVSGSHLSPRFGLGVRQIEADGFDVASTIEVLDETDTAEATTAAMARGLAGFGRYLAGHRPDLDRVGVQARLALEEHLEQHVVRLVAP